MSEKRKQKELNENELNSVTGGGSGTTKHVYPTITPPPARPQIKEGTIRIWAQCNSCGGSFIRREISVGVVTFEHKKCTHCGSYDFTETETVG